MKTADIEKDVTYLSIHDVPYLVLAIDGENNVTARCATGKSQSFKMPIQQFADSMKQARH